MNGIATLVGAIGTGFTMFNKYQFAQGGMGDKLVYAMTGYAQGGSNDPMDVLKRNLSTYGPLIAGVSLSKASSRFGVNRALPKGINL